MESPLRGGRRAGPPLHALHEGEAPPAWFRLSNPGITRIDFYDDGPAVAYLNRLDHLPTELIT